MVKDYKVKYNKDSFIVDVTVSAYSFKMNNRTVTFYDFNEIAVFAYCNVYSVELIEDI